MFDHICRRDEEIVDEGGRGANHQCLQKVYVVVLVPEPEFEVLIEGKIAGVRGDAPAGHDVRALPEPEQAFLLEEDAEDSVKAEVSTARLYVRLNKELRC